MNFFKYIFILVVFLKTGNVLSNSNIFNVNNIQVEKKNNLTNVELANQAITKGFQELINKILLKEEIQKLQDMRFAEIKKLVSYYQVLNKIDDEINSKKINFNIFFDKDKLHDLFYQKGISYSEIISKELFILPILKKNNKIFIYSKNYFYEKWNENNESELIEFILPLEKIEIIQNVNLHKDNLLNLEISELFPEYNEKNLALVLIEDENFKEQKIYLKTEIFGKSIVKNISVKKSNLTEEEFYKKIIAKTKQALTNIVKSQNLIDVRAPSFITAQLKVSNESSLSELKLRIKKIDSIEEIYIQEFNNKFVNVKIKYLGKMDKIIRQLKNEKIILKITDDKWSIKIN
jgi:hypothetical protein